MPAEIKLDVELVEHEEVTLAADPTVTTTVFDAEGCQSIQVFMVFHSPTIGDNTPFTVSEGDLANGADQIPSTVVPFTYPLFNAGAEQQVKIFEFKPAKRYFQVSFAGQAGTDIVHVIVKKGLCRAPGVGVNKPLVQEGRVRQSADCMMPSGCP